MGCVVRGRTPKAPMKKIIALTLAILAAPCALAQTSVGISIGINQPGVYGRINIGDLPPPALVLAQPVIITPAPVYVERRPIYLYVPAPHQRDWRRYCNHYNACGQPVYFVQEQWVRERYEQEHPGWDRRGKKGHDHDDDRGRGKDKGRGQDKGHGGRND